MAKLMLDTTRTSFEVSTNPVPKMDEKTKQQKLERDTNTPMWTVKLYALSEGQADVLQVTVVNPVMPQVAVRQPVVPVELEAMPWANKDTQGNLRSGVAFRCRDLQPIAVTEAVAA